MLKDIETIEDIQKMVDEFYGKIQEDQLIGPLFNEIIQDQWPKHLEKMYRFWQTVLLNEHTYYGSPFGPHAKLPINKKHFNRWLELFHQTVDEHFLGDKAEEVKWRSEKMAEMFTFKLNHIQKSNN